MSAPPRISAKHIDSSFVFRHYSFAMPWTTPTTAPRRPAVEPPRPDLRLAAIDVGSNSLHMIVAQIGVDGAVTTLWRAKEMVGLGRMSFPSRRLSREAMEQAILALRRVSAGGGPGALGKIRAGA